MTTRIYKSDSYSRIGCGHTGTTLVSGILHINGYGSFDEIRLFESTRLNEINERSISVGAPDTETDIRAVPRGPGAAHPWAAGVSRYLRLSWIAGSFYLLVDGAVGVIFNFRDPGSTVRSLIKEREMHEPYLTPGEMLRDSENELGSGAPELPFASSTRFYRPTFSLCLTTR